MRAWDVIRSTSIRYAIPHVRRTPPLLVVVVVAADAAVCDESDADAFVHFSAIFLPSIPCGGSVGRTTLCEFTLLIILCSDFHTFGR